MISKSRPEKADFLILTSPRPFVLSASPPPVPRSQESGGSYKPPGEGGALKTAH
jgi:hypothetical protein